MGDLFWNKIAGVVIGTILAVMVIGIIAEGLFPKHGEETEFAYPLDLASLGTGSGPAEEEPEIDLGTLLANASAEAGERIARRCVSCHTFEQGGANGTGPNLWGVVGAPKAAHAGFSYSAALSSMEGSWTYENLDAFIENPRGYVPGTNMSFAGLRGEEDRANLLAYLQTLSDNPVPFPAPAPAEAEAGEGEGDVNGDVGLESLDDADSSGVIEDANPLPEVGIESEAAAGDVDLADEPEGSDPAVDPAETAPGTPDPVTPEDEDNGDGEE
jgi:cytochrome c